MAPCFSILISCYNTPFEKIKRCIDSVLAQDATVWNPKKNKNSQTIENNQAQSISIEIIFVDDGSKPSLKNEILTNYGKQVIYVRHIKNKGLLETRRTGFKKSHGKYILFLDSDDELPQNNVLKTFYDIAEKENADIIQSEAIVKTNDYLKSSYKYEHLSTELHTAKNIVLDKDILSLIMPRYEITTYLWGKCFNRSVLEKTYKKIPKMYCVFEEDFLQIAFILYYAKKYVPIKDKLYTYYYEDGVSVKSKNIKSICSMSKVCPTLANFFSIENTTQNLKENTILTIEEITNNLINIDRQFLRNAIHKLLPHLDISENPKAWDTICANWGTEKAYKILENLTK